MNMLLAITPDQYSDKIIESAGFMETLGFGAMMLGIGMLAVFSVLCILWGALMIFRIVFYDMPSRKKAPAGQKVVETVPAKAAQAAPVAVASDGEIVAAIAAAIAMAESESTTGAKFRVVSFKRK